MTSEEELKFVHIAIEKGYLGKGTVSYALAYQKKCAAQNKKISLIEYFLTREILTSRQVQEIKDLCMQHSDLKYSTDIEDSEIEDETAILSAKSQLTGEITAVSPVANQFTGEITAVSPTAKTSEFDMSDEQTTVMNYGLEEKRFQNFSENNIVRNKTFSALEEQGQEDYFASSETLPAIDADDLEKKHASRHKIRRGEMFAHYRVEQEIGQGGMGTVYKVYDSKLERTVALKVVSGRGVSERKIKRFLQEAKATARLEHPNIVKVFEVGNSPENYFTMEYLEGPTLTQLIKEKPFKPVYAATIAHKIADALHTAHKNGIIHRDIKPSNIMMDTKREPKLMDFGLSKLIDSQDSLSISGEAVGTPAYMSPEQAGNKDNLDARSDVYSLGATLYEMLCGKPLFEGESYFDILNQVFHSSPTPLRNVNSDIPKDLEAICLKSVEKKVNRRYQSARGLAKDLKNFTERRSVSARPHSKFVKIKKFLLRYRSVGIAVLFLLLIASSIFLTYYQVNKEYRAKEEKYLSITKILLDNNNINPKEVSKNPDLKKDLQLVLQTLNDLQVPEKISSRKKLQKLLSGSGEEEQEKTDIPLATAYLYRGKIHFDQNSYEKAYRDFTKAIVLQKDYAEAYLYRGQLNLQLKKYPQAQQDLQETIELRNGDVSAYYHLGILYMAQEKWDNAKKNFEAGNFIDSEDPKLLFALGEVALKTKSLAPAKQYFEKALKYKLTLKQLAKTYEYLGELSFKKKHYAEARRYFDKAIALNSKGELYYARAVCYDKQGQAKRALEDLYEAKKLNYSTKKVNKLIQTIRQRKK